MNLVSSFLLYSLPLVLMSSAPKPPRGDLPRTSSFKFQVDGGAEPQEDRMAFLMAKNEQIAVDIAKQTQRAWMIEEVWCTVENDACMVEFRSEHNDRVAMFYIWRKGAWAVFANPFTIAD